MSIREQLADDRLFDNSVVSHGFVEQSRDYEIVFNVVAALPPEVPIGDTVGSYVEGRYRYRFTHCPEVHLLTAVDDATWRRSWDDVFVDFETWKAAGSPEGFVWGVDAGDAYPGLSLVEPSDLAASWTERLGHDMHEVRLETNAFDLTLVCHDLRLDKLAAGDPITGTLTPIDR